MLNFKDIKNNYDFFQKSLKKKNFFLEVDKLIKLEQKRKIIQIKSEKQKFLHKKLSNYMRYIRNIYKNTFFFEKYLFSSKKKVLYLINKLTLIKQKLNNILINIPNIPDPSVPEGIDASKNIELMRWGIVKKKKTCIQSHVNIAKKLNGFDSEKAVSISGAGYVILKNKIARLHRALGQFMIDIHTQQHGYEEIYVPHLINEKCMFGTGQLPKFKEELFQINLKKKTIKNIENIKNLFLIPTAEAPLINLVRNTVVSIDILPLKFVALSSCFRAEPTTYGKKNQGLIRNNQFEKVEIVQITSPNQSQKALEELTKHAEKILRLLELPYRKILLCTGDLGFSALKTYDLEVWLPYQNNYCEISSCSMIGDFQARRINAKFKDNKTKKKYFLHTLNGSGLAVGRTLAAILENFQCSNGRVKIPKILQNPYMNGEKFL